MRIKVLGGAVAALAGAGLVLYALAQLQPVGIDYYYWYWPIPRAWLAGETRLYDEYSRQFFSPPWALWLLLPFSALDIRWGMAALTVTSLAIVATVSYAYAQELGGNKPGVIAVLAVLCPYSLTTFFVGTLDAWALLGVYLCFFALRRRRPWVLGPGLLLAVVRPQDAVLTVPMLLLEARKWPLEDAVKAAILPAVVLGASFLGFGWDWPLRWWLSYFALPPAPYLATSTYAATSFIGIPLGVMVAVGLLLAGWVARRVWKEGLTPGNLDLTVTANAVVSPYMLSQSYVVLLALPWAGLAARRPLRATLPYLVSLPLLTRAQGLWDRLGLLDVTFPMVLLVLLLLEPRPIPARENVAPHPTRVDPPQG